VSAWYVSFVDLEWLTDRQMRSSAFGQNMTEAEIAQMAQGASGRRGVQVVIVGLTSSLGVALVLAITALYYMLAGKVTGVERSFRDGLALASWTSTPTLLALIPAAFILLTAVSNQIGQEALQPLSLNALLFHRAPGDPGYSLLNSLNLLQFV